MHTWVFIAFCVAYVLWTFGAIVVLLKIVSDVRKNRSFVNSELATILSLAGMFGFIYLLSGFFSLSLTILVVLAAQLGIAISGVLWALIGSYQTRWAERAAWAGAELQAKNPVSTMLIGLASAIVLFGYPVLAGILYYGHHYPPAQMTIRVIQLTLLYTFASTLVAQAPLLVRVLSSPDIDEQTRTRFLVVQLGGLVPTALLLALFYWTLPALDTGNFDLSAAGVSLQFSPTLIVVLVLYFVLLILLPYLVGAKRGRETRSQLLERRDDWLKELGQRLRAPTGLGHAAALLELQTGLASEWNSVAASDSMIAWGIGMQLPPAQAAEFKKAFQGPIVDAFKDTRADDERFSYMDWLRETQKATAEIAAELQKSTVAEDIDKAATNWADVFREQGDDVQAQIKNNEESKSPGVIFAAWATPLLMSPILDALGKELAGRFLHLS